MSVRNLGLMTGVTGSRRLPPGNSAGCTKLMPAAARHPWPGMRDPDSASEGAQRRSEVTSSIALLST
jgi:hypothetical protein